MYRMRIPVLLAAVIAVFAVSVAPAMAFNNFVAKAGMGQIKGKSIGNQIFKTGSNPEVKCSLAEASGKVLAEKVTEQSLAFKYPVNSCLVGSFIPVSITEEQYTFYINGQVKLNNEVKVEASNCKLVVPGNQKFGLGSVTYGNNGLNLKGEAKVKGIEYKGTGFTCPNSGTNGEYEGTEELEGNKPPNRVNVE
jgi:hypothetical protein